MISPSRSSSTGPNANFSRVRSPTRNAHLSDLAGRASTPSEMASVTRLRVDLFMTLGRSDRAVEVGLDCLRRFGIDWSAHPDDKGP